ncbi:TPA: pleiotropic regulatory protein RsmS [Providencia rettgeri]|uniref:pleiotropic regulatory protein RsmS n=1 Tax=Providencia TaxID=586 RepID=UPI001B901F89|nr:MULTISPECIES: pleiotropic regulatory protein RsmS [Providencia]EMB5786252.1 pleiotropic regulatory protein RsmS [Providencia rettgeri]MDK7744422.1 pleiotropic regulatory protein RsmS [Providencia rettgeri]MDK7757144.1 pleiotropic regulatory protein RsmS [Providencia rettgeri]HBC7428772.1 pleiotropic regulatory protein RsmS [Providencia rettgeri]
MSSLKDAPQEVQLAVDLIYLLETAEIDTDVVLKALEIVKNDYMSKQVQAAQATCTKET